MEYGFDIDSYDPSTCPFCGSGEVERLGFDGEADKRRCGRCGEGFALWYDEPHDAMPVEVTDGRGRPLV